MYEREIEILISVFGENFIYINSKEKDATFRGTNKLDYNYACHMVMCGIFEYNVFLYDDAVYLLNIDNLEMILIDMITTRNVDISYFINSILHIYREKLIDTLI